ncbi:MAG TPA: fused MFS/spermidine synthase, partial [Gemmata sp.]|nr:fused MFS/spermidine synthase [Gemmata sp.]
MPLLFAATLFVSASLLFMIQPMVGKMVLPLLGGSPAVWNACMVFFQALLLLGYLYAHHVSAKYQPRQQWLLHLAVLGLPLAAFCLAVMFGARHSPIAIAESLAPGGNSSPVLSVLLLLTVAIGVPFFVISTSAPLLQKWFTCTGHPSARDPYFLYSASNIGSMISLLGYPLFIEPYLSIIGQAWVFALGFAILAAMVALCGHAAANPIGVPPATAQLPSNKPVQKNLQQNSEQGKTGKPVPPSTEEPPTLFRKLKWIALAFVPSSLMLGVTFYMTTDIASIPLLWVGPLALYLITFIIAFARLPDWFRLVIGNLAPVMILLLVFVFLSSINFGIGIVLLIHLLTFFAAALMCHYELARDRPSPQFLTEFFLLMSVGGVLGGIFNSLLAPLIFPHAYEYRIVLILACMMVPRLSEMEASEKTKAKKNAREQLETLDRTLIEVLKGTQIDVNSSASAETPRKRFPVPIPILLDILIPIAVGVGFYYYQDLTSVSWFARTLTWIAETLKLSIETIVTMIIFGVPVMLCFFFVDRPVRFGLCVAAILGYSTYKEEVGSSIHSERSFFGILKVEETYEQERFFVDTMMTEEAFAAMRNEGVPETVIAKLKPLMNTKLPKSYIASAKILTPPELEKWDKIIISSSRMSSPERVVIRTIDYRRLVHGTTLHGTQIYKVENKYSEIYQALTGTNPWNQLLVIGANQVFDPQQEPLTYYHRTGPVGAMVHELRCRKGGADAKAHFAMVGLGTGSASCYAETGQKLDFYEIDPAVRHLTYDIPDYFTYVSGAFGRGALLDIHMGDARLKLKEKTDKKYALLLVDAFSSDSIPVHLLTKEAVQLYLNRMTDDGILALHISNKYVRLEPVVAAIARDMGLTARVWNDDLERDRPGKTASSWVALAQKQEHLGSLYSPIGD